MLGMAWEELEPRILLSAVSLAGDTNHDGRVNAQDYMAMKQVYAEGSQPDLLALAGNFGSQLVEISEPGVLDQDRAYYLVTCDMTVIGTGFSVTADYATLDFDGHAVAAGPMATTAVSVVNSVGATVRNGLILGPFAYGVWVDDSPGASLRGLTVTAGSNKALVVDGSPGVSILGCLIPSAGVAISVRESPGTRVDGNTVADSDQAVWSDGSAVVENNTVRTRATDCLGPPDDRTWDGVPKTVFLDVRNLDGTDSARDVWLDIEAFAQDVTVQDDHGNVVTATVHFGQQQTVRLYLRARPDVFDYGWLLPDPPDTVEYRTCGRVVEFTPTGFATPPGAVIVRQDIHLNYRGSGALGGLLLGSAVRTGPFEAQDPMVYQVELTPSYTYAWADVRLNHERAIPDWNDYGLTIELLGLGPSVKTTPLEPSYVDVTYVC